MDKPVSEMVERVARAICIEEEFDPDGPHPEDAAEGVTDGFPLWLFYRPAAIAAIKAMREATDEMVEQGVSAYLSTDLVPLSEVWDAMVLAALGDTNAA